MPAGAEGLPREPVHIGEQPVVSNRRLHAAGLRDHAPGSVHSLRQRRLVRTGGVWGTWQLNDKPPCQPTAVDVTLNLKSTHALLLYSDLKQLDVSVQASSLFSAVLTHITTAVVCFPLQHCD